MQDGFTCKRLDDRHVLHLGHLPQDLVPDDQDFDALWRLHPDDYHEINIHGRKVKTPRWQQAYGKDYYYTNRVNKALPIPDPIQPYVDWSRRVIDRRLNGVLLNWYDGRLGHYIGPHRDSTKRMVHGAVIVTISLGERRMFRLRPWKGAGKIDLDAHHGRVFVTPYDTNLAWTHEVPRQSANRDRRISITLRAFSD